MSLVCVVSCEEMLQLGVGIRTEREGEWYNFTKRLHRVRIRIHERQILWWRRTSQIEIERLQLLRSESRVAKECITCTRESMECIQTQVF